MKPLTLKTAPRETTRSTDYRAYGRKHKRRRRILLRQHTLDCARANRSLCEDCYAEGEQFKAISVEWHHVEKVADTPERAADVTNLMWLCKRHHSQRTARGE